jgi:plastocyanin/predicted MPP superfamily phosphohydrolase
MADRIVPDLKADGIDRRGFLKCMAWAGTGLLCSIHSGVLTSRGISEAAAKSVGTAAPAELTFAQISDSHIGFNKAANPDVAGTLRAAVEKINALPTPPAFLLHTGDLTHLSKPEEFDAVDQILKEARTSQVFYVPGEHDVLTDNGKQYRDRYGKGTEGDGWYSFDRHGVHFIGLVNVLNLKPGGLGTLGTEQLEWLEKDLKRRSSDTPIIVFAHVPLWTVYKEWGWGTDDSAQALSYLKRFGSVTVLNGHIHQTLQKIEGNITFHTATSTAFPQPKPGTAPSPGPMTVPADQLRHLLGITSVRTVQRQHPLAIVDAALDPDAALSNDLEPASSKSQVKIDNFRFTPGTLTVPVGATVTWSNHDDVPHTVVSTKKRFASRALDTDEEFSYLFTAPGTYPYYCSVHPMMTGTVVVR